MNAAELKTIVEDGLETPEVLGRLAYNLRDELFSGTTAQGQAETTSLLA
jgi:hypothetical protein